MAWSDVSPWISVVVIAASVFAAAGVVAAVHIASRRSGSSSGRGLTAEAGAAAVLLGGWLLVSLALAGAGVFRARETGFPQILLGVAVPVVIGSALLSRSSTARRLTAAIPAHWSLAAQAPRVFGLTFLVLLAQHKLPAVFAYRAGYGDILVGIAAPLVAYAFRSGRPWSRRVAVGFNLFGLADLVVAIGTGVLAAPGPMRQIFSIPSTELMTALPMVMVPVFLVPLFTLIHLFSLRQLLHEARNPERATSSGRGRKPELAPGR